MPYYTMSETFDLIEHTTKPKESCFYSKEKALIHIIKQIAKRDEQISKERFKMSLSFIRANHELHNFKK